MNLLPSWLKWSLCVLPVAAATVVSWYLPSRELAVGLLGFAVILSFGVLRSIVEGYEARVRRLEDTLTRREQPVP
jgi:hypothetical protein